MSAELTLSAIPAVLDGDEMPFVLGFALDPRPCLEAGGAQFRRGGDRCQIDWPADPFCPAGGPAQCRREHISHRVGRTRPLRVVAASAAGGGQPAAPAPLCRSSGPRASVHQRRLGDRRLDSRARAGVGQCHGGCGLHGWHHGRSPAHGLRPLAGGDQGCTARLDGVPHARRSSAGHASRGRHGLGSPGDRPRPRRGRRRVRPLDTSTVTRVPSPVAGRR